MNEELNYVFFSRQWQRKIYDADSNTIICKIGGDKEDMVIDSGAHVNTTTEEFWERNKHSKGIFNIRTKTSLNATGYASNKKLQVIATFNAKVEIDGKPPSVEEFFVIKDAKKGLLGRFASKRMKILLVGLEVPDEIGNIVDGGKEFPKIPNIQIKLNVDPNVQPKQCGYYKIPYPIEDRVDARYKKYDACGVTEDVPLGSSEWISGVIAVPKGDNDLRLCVDMKNPNKAIIRENYPLPTIEDFAAKLHGAKFFSVIDLSDAYFHVELHPDSRPLTTFITKNGLKRFTRLMFGVNSAPEQFQRVMDQLFNKCEGVKSFIDDTLIWGNTEQQHDERLNEALTVYKENNLTINDTKSVFKQKEVKFLGHIINEDGMRAAIDKVESVKSFKLPTTPSELRGFLGLANFIGRFVQGMASHTEILREMLREKSMEWTEARKQAFEDLKHILCEPKALAFFDVKAQSILYTDASPTGIGAVLIQIQDGVEKPIAYASKSLTPTERRYPQTQREALGAVWGIERFYYYLYGAKFKLKTDYRALKFIWKLNDISSSSKRAVSRAESYALRLMPFDFEIEHVKGEDNIADCLSRIVEYSEEPEPFIEDHPVFLARIEVDDHFISKEELVEATKSDEEIQKVISAVQTGSWNSIDVVYRSMKKDLEVEDGLLFKDFQVVVPSKLRQRFLRMAHSTHAGMVSMKRIVRDRAWWPRLNVDVEKMVKSCHACQLMGPKNKPVPLVMSEIPKEPFATVAIDFLEIEKGVRELLMVTDLYSKFLIIKTMSSTTTELTIEKLDEIYSFYSFPKNAKQDNGSQFISKAYEDYCKSKGIHMIFSPPLNPESNGEIESRNKGILKAIRAGKIEGKPWKDCVRDYMRNYNSTPHSLTLITPFELFMRRRPNIRLEDIRENPWTEDDAIERAKAERLRVQDAENTRRGVSESDIKVGDKVLVLQTSMQNKLLPKFLNRLFRVESIIRNEAKIVEVGTNTSYRRALNHLKKWHEPSSDNSSTIESENQPSQDLVTHNTLPSGPDTSGNSSRKRAANDDGQAEPRRGGRGKKPPARLIETCNITS